jgi:hypothetical protein
MKAPKTLQILKPFLIISFNILDYSGSYLRLYDTGKTNIYENWSNLQRISEN